MRGYCKPETVRNEDDSQQTATEIKKVDAISLAMTWNWGLRGVTSRFGRYNRT